MDMNMDMGPPDPLLIVLLQASVHYQHFYLI